MDRIKRRGLRQVPELTEGATFLRKWGFIGVLIGIGALLLSWFIEVVTKFALGTIAGYTPPPPGGEGGNENYISRIALVAAPHCDDGRGIDWRIVNLEVRSDDSGYWNERG